MVHCGSMKCAVNVLKACVAVDVQISEDNNIPSPALSQRSLDGVKCLHVTELKRDGAQAVSQRKFYMKGDNEAQEAKASHTDVCPFRYQMGEDLSSPTKPGGSVIQSFSHWALVATTINELTKRRLAVTRCLTA